MVLSAIVFYLFHLFDHLPPFSSQIASRETFDLEVTLQLHSRH